MKEILTSILEVEFKMNNLLSLDSYRICWHSHQCTNVHEHLLLLMVTAKLWIWQYFLFHATVVTSAKPSSKYKMNVILINLFCMVFHIGTKSCWSCAYQLWSPWFSLHSSILWTLQTDTAFTAGIMVNNEISNFNDRLRRSRYSHIERMTP